MAKQSRGRMSARDLKRRRQTANRRARLHSAESLEARLALSVSSITNIGLDTNQAQGLPSDWVVILGSNADDVFIQRVATGELSNPDQQDLLVANNSSFLNAGPGTYDEIDDIDSLGSIYVTNGQEVTVANVLHDQYPLTSLPTGVAAAGPWRTTFVLSRQQIEDTEACNGIISYGGNVWTFTNNVVANSNPFADVYPSNLFTITGPVTPVQPVAIAFADAASATGDAVAIVTWSGFPLEALPTIPGPSLAISYDADNDQRGPVLVDGNGNPFYSNFNQDFQTDVNRLPSAGPVARFTVPVTNVHPGGIVNGTLRALVDVNGNGDPDFLITPAQLFGPLENRLVFTDLVTGAGPAVTGTFQTADGDSDQRVVSGFYNPLTGAITLQFFDGGNPQAVNGPVSILLAEYATYDQDPLPMTATFFAGLDIHNEVYVDLLTSGSTISVENPIIQSAQNTELAVGADIDLRATNVNIDATMLAIDEIRIGASRVVFPEIAQANAYAVIGAAGTPEEGQVVDIVVPAGWGGLGYTAALPVVVWIAPPLAGGTQAVATAVIQNGVVVSVRIDDPGSGYSTDSTLGPQVSISPPPALPPVPGLTLAPPFPVFGLPTPASAAFAVVGSDPDLPNYGQIIDVVMPFGFGGSGYDPVNPPQVFIAPPPAGGTLAVVTAVVIGGVVVGFTIVDPGAGYLPGPTSPPAVTIAPPALVQNLTPVSTGVAQGFAVIDAGEVVAIGIPPGLGGQGYDILDPPPVFIAPPPPGGTQATAEAVVENGVVVRIDITDPGAGYTTPPAVTIAPPPPMPPIGPGFIDPETNGFPAVRATGRAPVAEQVSIDAAVAAQFFDIRLGDDPATEEFPRGRLFVSNSGSLSGDVQVIASPSVGAVQTAAKAVFVQADNADLIIEGNVVATEQTYLMQSRKAVDPDPTDGLEPEHEPYVFTTRSPATGAQTGTIAGGVLAITLGNDAPTEEVGASAVNIVDLETRVDSIRVKAATRAGAPLTGPFPYDLTIAEFDGVTIDAVAASGRPINLSSGGDMFFRAALATGSDLTLTANGAFNVTSPVTSTRGQINVTGTSVAVNNSLRVLDPIVDPTRDDITLRALAGDINLAGLVSAVNNVNLIQANSDGPRTYSVSPLGGVPVRDNSTVTVPLVISDNFVFTDINVVVDVRHQAVGELSIALVSPNGTVIVLKDNGGVGGFGDDMVGTVFDSEASATLDFGLPPFSGSFQPVESLVPLYGGNTQGTWLLRVSDLRGGGNVGQLLTFGLQFAINGENFGTVGGPTRVVAERLNVEAEGVVSLFTNVDRLEGVAGNGFTINEQDDIAITSLRSPGLVSLRAAGVDAGLENRYTDNAIALTAYLIDVTNLEASAPQGSMEIIADTAQKLVLGRADAIAAGLADPMKAAGTVTIRSKAGNIDVLDAPLPGLPPNVVRVVTTGNLAATYAQNQPGTRSSTLTATINGSLNAGTGVDGVTDLRIGDRVLVRNQSNAAQNGIYSITSLGSSTTRWVLTRATDSDTAFKLLDNMTVTALDGVQAGKVFKFAYDNVRGTSPIGVAVVPNRPEAVPVRAATEGSLFGVYDDAAGTITSVPDESLPLVNGIALQVGDRLLVRAGSHSLVDPGTRLPLNTTRVSNGAYEVVDAGGPGLQWQIQRIPEMDGVDDFGLADPNELLGYVNVREGSLSTASVQGAYRLAFRSLGISPLTVSEVTNSTEIGSDNRDSLVTFVVSSAGGTASEAGSLGKMIALRQVNNTERLLEGAPAGTQAMDFRFSTLVARPIQLTQQLPEVTKSFVIDGARRYTPAGVANGPSARIEIDGTRINVDRFGRRLFSGTLSVTRSTISTLVVPRSYTRFPEIRVGMLVTGPAIKAGAKVLAINAVTRTLTLTSGSVVGTGVTSVTITTEINGLDFRAGSGAAVNPDTGVLEPGAILANVNVGGFANGAAVSVEGGGGALIRNTIIGQTAAGGRLLSRFGVLVGGTTTSATILNNLIVGQSGAGVRVQDSASGVTVVGNTIGSALLPNEVGISLGSTGSNRIGVDPIAPSQTVFPGTATRNLAANTVTLPASYAGFTSLFVNLGVKGAGIAAGARIAAIDPTTRVVTLTPGGVTASGTGLVTFGNLVDTVEFERTLVLPAGVNIADVYLGLGVNGAGIRPGSTVTAIDIATRAITLSQEMTATASGVPVTFATPGRNTISFNRYGMLLAAGANTVTRSNVFSNTFDGIKIVGGQQTIGTSKQYSPRSNSIYSNGGYGINIATPAVVSQQTIQGNFLGTPAPGTIRLVNRLGNLSVILPKWTPNAITNVDPEGNVHGPGNRLTTPTGGTGGGGTGGGSTNPPGVFPL
jgi:subtilisin-like proprotein convertase family protein